MRVTDSKKGSHIEKPATWYNKHYKQSEEYRKEPEEIFYYPMWKHAISWIGSENIIDLGCGPGQFANLLFKENKNLISAVDFSSQAIDMAKKANPGHEEVFKVGNILLPAIFNVDYRTAVSFEVLEHINNDIGVIRYLKRGTKFIFSVPNYDYTSHVRFFKHKTKILERYSPYLEFKKLTSFKISDRKIIFLAKTIKK